MRNRPRPRGRPSDEVLQRRLDLAGLASIGLAVYLGYVIYLGWNGGTVGNGSETALEYAVGAGAIVVPAALGLAGIGLILRPFLPSPRSVAVGVVAIACGLLLALAAQTAGLGPDGVRKDLFDPNFFPHHGGGLGEVLYWATTTLFQRIGAQIIAVLLLVSGLLLITGRSVSDMVRAGRRGFDRAKRGTVGFATAIKESRISTDPDLIDTTPADTEPVFGPPEPVADGDDFQVLVGGEDEQETERVANFDEAVRVADEPDTSELEDLEGDSEAIRVAKADAPEGEPADEGEPESEEQPEPALTPMGEKRGGVTESEEIDYETPNAEQVLERGKPDKGPDTRDHEEVARTLLEALGHFGVEARIVGTVTGPHVSRYELKLAPGTKVSKITQLKDDLAYALASTDIRILAPIPGKQAVGVEVPNQRRRLVRLGDIYGGRPQGSSPLVAWLGKDISGSAVWTDLQKMPH
ncbi:MAG TPA: DNA translocase FtsK 4TM domain-containing protein, partial [Solirubrobacterales bacterium]